MKNLTLDPRIKRVVGDMCRFGMTQVDECGEHLFMKPTGYLTNSPKIATELSLRCTTDHHHVQLMGGRASAAEVYPAQLSEAKIRGLKKHFVEDKKLRPGEPLLSVCTEFEDLQVNNVDD